MVNTKSNHFGGHFISLRYGMGIFFGGMLISYELRHEISNNVVCATGRASHQLAHTHSLIRASTSH